MPAIRITPVVIATALLITACGKVEEKTSEKLAEAAIESAMKKDGASDAKVDLSTGGVKATVTDKNGKSQTLELNNAKVTEQDAGIPFYPGATPIEGSSSRISSAEGNAVSTTLSTGDALDKVVAFYSPQIKRLAAGKQMIESSEGGEYSWMVSGASGTANDSLMVQARRNGNATEIMIHATHAK